VEPDLHEHFGIDLSDPAIRHGRTWRWLQVRILALLSIDSRLYRHFKPPEPPPTRRR
jgi:hypothetical protein